MGHGGGKTSFCRLMRYCLGEDSFGSHAQRELIAARIPNGYVGAEVILDGVQWTVIRPIGVDNRHYCAQGVVLDAAYSDDIPNTGVAPLRQAITSALMDEAANRMPLTHPRDDAWETALAWLSRDQECRLLGPLDWRAAQTQSRSPSRQRQLSDADRLVIVRLLLNALQVDEMSASDAARSLRDEIEKARAQQRRLEWLINDLREGLSETFGSGAEEVPNQTDFWAEQATSKLHTAENAAGADIFSKLKAARKDEQEAENGLRVLEGKISVIDGRLASVGELKKVLDDTRAKRHTHVIDAQSPRCKTCGRVLDQAGADFIAERQQEANDTAKQLGELVNNIGALKQEQDAIKYQLATAKQELVPIRAKIAQLENQSIQIAEAKGYVTMTARYAQHLTALGNVSVTIGDLTVRLGDQNRQIKEIRRSSLDTVNRLSQLFDICIRQLVPDNAKGRISIEEGGLHLALHLGGERSTAAVDSLKVVAFDLATLLLSMEGRTQLPAFLIHDSPREADLGLSIYNRIFELGKTLEGFGEGPIFQYIITTTTAPPDDFRNDHWVKLELHGAPSEQRLFQEDL